MALLSENFHLIKRDTALIVATVYKYQLQLRQCPLCRCRWYTI